MVSGFGTPSIASLIEARWWPTVTVYNRLEGRPRTRTFERSLRAEVRDGLWMLTRQWQVGEYIADDAGSPIEAKLQLGHRDLTKYRPREHPAEPLDQTLPLEARAERRPVPLRLRGRPLSLDLRIVMGRQWLKLIADVGNYAGAFRTAYAIDAPNPTVPGDADQAAHPEVFQAFAAAAGRLMDGGALYEHLKELPTNRAYDGVAGIADADKPELDVRAERFVAWFERLVLPPSASGEDAWDAARLEYRFACSAPEEQGEKVYAADEYHGGHLDWWAFDVDRREAGLGDTGGAAPPATAPDEPYTLIPTSVVFEGMPDARWWAFEDRRTNFGDVDAATTDVAKLMFLEFGLVTSNDWFLVPADLPTGVVADVRGIAVTNVFGERTWIEPAGAGADDAWQRWSMFTVAVQGEGVEAADTSLLLPATVPKIQQGDPVEQVLMIRDELANMVWGIEWTIPLPSGAAKPGAEAGRETHAYLQRLLGSPASAPTPRVADVRYQIVTSVPEQWIPFVPVHVPGDTREIQLQRAGLPRIIEGGPPQLTKVQPRTVLLREGLDLEDPRSYFVHEEEVPRDGTQVAQAYQRTRWRGGRAVVWLGVQRQTGRGSGSSGLAFDQLVSVPPAGP
jgi:hypothetical protein